MEIKTEREVWLDIAKGILIILVVMGHSIAGPFYDLNNPIDYVYLFHMPAFFMISGYLHKSNNIPITAQIYKKIKRLLLPYFIYLIIINVPQIFISLMKTKSLKATLSSLGKLLYGGQYLNSTSGVLWFLTCLLFIEIIFILLDKYVIKSQIKIFIICLFYIVAHLQAWFFSGMALPLAIDISFIAISYFAFGVYCKEYIFHKANFILSFMLVVIFVALRMVNRIDYGLELWGHHYINFFLDFIIPILFSIVIFNISKKIEKIKFANILAELGRYTLPIMCLHIITNKVVQKVTINYGVILFICIGVIVPFLIAKYIFKKSKLLNALFIG